MKKAQINLQKKQMATKQNQDQIQKPQTIKAVMTQSKPIQLMEKQKKKSIKNAKQTPSVLQ